jgi:hypothetical protein
MQELKPGDQLNETIPVRFVANVPAEDYTLIPAGDYRLKASRRFTVNGKEYELVSNLLRVHISPPKTANWGKSIQGVQLSITMTNNVFQVGSSTMVESLTTNGSEDPIIVKSPLELFYDVSIKSESGKLYHVITRSTAIPQRI